MECFIDHIKLKIDDNANVALNELYINQLPGISFKMITAIKDDDNRFVIQMWTEIQRRALRRFKKDYKAKFSVRYVGYCYDNDENCNPEKIACDNISHFEDTWMYCLGIELMLERLYTNRMNRYTTIDKDQASELRDHYTVEYEKSINHAIKYLPKDVIDNCFECRSSVDYVERLP